MKEVWIRILLISVTRCMRFRKFLFGLKSADHAALPAHINLDLSKFPIIILLLYKYTLSLGIKAMAEQSLSDIVIHLISWIESLHEKNLKYEAQVETLSRDLAKAQNSNEQLEAKLSAYQLNHSQQQLQPPVSTSAASFHQHQANENRPPISTGDQHHILNTQQQEQQNQHHILHHTQLPSPASTASLQHITSQPQHTQVIYQPIPVAGGPSFMPQPQYVWTAYDTGVSSNGNGGYYDQYSSAAAPAVIAPAAFVQPQP